MQMFFTEQSRSLAAQMREDQNEYSLSEADLRKQNQEGAVILA